MSLKIFERFHFSLFTNNQKMINTKNVYKHILFLMIVSLNYINCHWFGYFPTRPNNLSIDYDAFTAAIIAIIGITSILTLIVVLFYIIKPVKTALKVIPPSNPPSISATTV